MSKAPQIYRKLFVAGYNAIKSVDPMAQVLIGETVPYGKVSGLRTRVRLGLATPPLQWLRGVLCPRPRSSGSASCRGNHDAARRRRAAAAAAATRLRPTATSCAACSAPTEGRYSSSSAPLSDSIASTGLGSTPRSTAR
jgi:hypothetical protein